MKNIFISFFAFLTVAVSLSAQSIEINKRFGKVSKEELELSVYQLDTSAVALMLYDKKDINLELTPGANFVLTTNVHRRIKILKEEGLEWGNFSLLRYVSPSLKESVNGIEVVTYNLEDGKVIETKMDRSFLYEEEESSSYRKLSFYAQNVKVGSVIEVKYKVISELYWEIDDVYLQRTIPVNCAEVEVRIPSMFTFNKKTRGYHHIDYKQEVEAKSLDSFQYRVGFDKYTAVDIPAFKYESYIYYPEQYFAAISYDVRSLDIPGVTKHDFGVTWNDVDDSYKDSELMLRFRSHCHFKDQVDALPQDASDMARIASAVSLVKSNVVWNGKYRMYPNQLGRVVKERSASNAEINCLIAGCLREMGYNVDMVMVKLRSSGRLFDLLPERFPYDTFILKVTGADGKEYYLDGGSSCGYINVLPADFLVPNARLILKDGPGQWVDLTKLTRNRAVISVTATLDESMRMKGEYKSKETGNPSLSTKSSYASFSTEDSFTEDIESDNGIEIDEVTFEEINEYSPSVVVNYSFTKDINAIGEYVYVTPFISVFHSKDTFQSLERQYPVDFPFPYALNYQFIFTIPEGYAVEQLPEGKTFKFDSLGSSARTIFALQGNTLKMVYNFSRNENSCDASCYNDLRVYWQYLADIYDSVIVLKKL